jgi:hypothetical protein
LTYGSKSQSEAPVSRDRITSYNIKACIKDAVCNVFLFARER